jgi:peptide deformylase
MTQRMVDAKPYMVVLYPALILRKRAREVTPEELRAGRAGDVDLRELVARMLVTAREEDGVGLAAPQVGVGLRLFVAQPDPREDAPLVVFNPVLGERRGVTMMEEGCLSLPGIKAQIRRAQHVLLMGHDQEGNAIRVSAEGLPARIFQHETDHLDGILITQRMGTAARFMLRHALQELEERYELRKRRRALPPARLPVGRGPTPDPSRL